MKVLPFLFIISGLAPLLLSSCKKEDHSEHTVLNINYPAAYVVNGGSGTVSVINLTDQKVQDQISLNGATYPHHIYFNQDKSLAAVAITATDLSGGHAGHGNSVAGLKVQIINTVTGEIVKEISLTKLPHNAVFNPSGSELWIGQMDTMQSQVLVYNTADWSLKKTISVGKGLSEVTFSGNGLKVFAANTMDNTVSIISPSTYDVEKTLVVGADPVGAWPGTDGNMYVDNELSKDVSVISVSTGLVMDTIPLGYKPGFVAQHSNGEVWVSDATNGGIGVYEPMGDHWMTTAMITTGADAHGIAFNSDGSKAYVTNQGAATVSVIDVATHKKLQDIGVGSKPNGLILKQ
ncbi:MAG TPA: YncE family protein [Catalimonadaceae bacterium]|jgi:YVTN family beta-propeller protein|nr:YncE family protein [Catalimonadaceae bacterium]